MSSQSAKKKRFGSRRRVANQNEGRAETDELHGTDSTSVAQCSITEEKTEPSHVSANMDSLYSETQSTASPEPEANKRKLGSRRRNKGGQHESATESYRRSRKDVEEEIEGNQTPEMAQVTLTMQLQGQEELSEGSELDMSATHDSSLHCAITPDDFTEVQSPNTTVCQHADVEGLTPKRESIQSKQVENDATLVETEMGETEKVDSLQSEEHRENVHLVGTSELTGLDVLSNPTEDQQLINQPNNTEMSEEELPNDDYSVTEIQSKEGDKELFGQDGKLQDNDWGSESASVSQFTTTPEITSGNSCTVENAQLEYTVEQEIFSSLKEDLLEDGEQNEHVSLSEDKGVLHLEDDVKEVNEQEFKSTREPDHSSEGLRHEQVEDTEYSGNLTDQAVVSVTYQSEMFLKTTNDSAIKQGDLNPGDKQDEHPAKETVDAFEEIYETDKLPISGTQRGHIAPSLICETEVKIEDDLKPITEQTDHQKEEGILFEVEDINSAVQTLQSETNAPLDSQTLDNSVRTEEETNAELNPLVNRRKLGSSRRNKGRQHVKRSVAESCDDHKSEAVRVKETYETTQISEVLERAHQEESSQGSDHDVAMSVTHDSSFYSAITPNDPSEVENPSTTNYPQTDLESLITKSDLQEQHDGRDTDLQVELSDKPVEVMLEEKDKSNSLQRQEVRDAYYSEEDVNIMHEVEVKSTHEINDSSEIVTYDATESSAMISVGLTGQAEVSDTDQSELIGKDTDDSNKPGEQLTEENHLEAAYHTNPGYDMPEELQVRGIETVDTEQEQKHETEDQEEGSVKPSAEKNGEERIFSDTGETELSLQTLPSEMCVSPATESYHRSTEEGVGNAIDVEPLETTKMSLTEQTTPQEKSVEGMDTLDTVQIEEVSAQVKESTQCSISEHTTTSFTEDQHLINQSHFREMPEEDANLSEVTEHQHAEGDVNAEHEDVVKPTEMQEMHQIDFSSNLEDEFTLQTLHPDTNAPLDSQLLDNSLRPEEEIHSGLGNRRKLGSSRRNKGRQQVKRSVAESCDDHKREAVETRGSETTHISEALERTSQGSDHDVAMSVTHDSSFYSAITPNDPSEVENPSTTNYPQTDLESLITKSDLQEQHDGRDTDLQVELSDKPVEVMLEEKDKSNSLQRQEVRDTYFSEEDVNMMHEVEVKSTHETNDSSEIVTYDATESSAMISVGLTGQAEVSDTDQSELIGKDTDDSNKPGEQLTEENHLEAAYHTNPGYDMPEELQVRGIETVDHEQEQKHETEDQEEGSVKPSAEKNGEERIFSDTGETELSLETLPSEMCVSPAAESYHSSTEEGVGNAIVVEPLEITKMSLTEQTTPQEKSVEGMDSLDTVQIEEVSAQVKESTQCSISEHTTTSFTEDQHLINQSHFREMPEEDANLSEVTEHQHAEGDVNAEHEDVVKPTEMQEMHQTDFSSNLEDEFTLQTLHPDTNAPLDSQLLDNSLRPEEETHSGLGNRRKLGSSRRNKGRQQVKRSVAESCDDHKREAVETRGSETTHISEALERTSQSSDHDVAMSVTHDSSFYSAITPNDPSEVENPSITNYLQTDLESLITKSDLQEQHDGRDTDLQVELSDKPEQVMLEEKDKSNSLQRQEVRDTYYSEEDVNMTHEVEVKSTHETNDSSEIVTYDATESSAMISVGLTGQAEVSDTDQSELIGKDTDDSNKPGEQLTEENHLEAAYHTNPGYDMTEELEVRGIETVDTEQEQKHETEDQEEGSVKPSAEKNGEERIFSDTGETELSLQTLPSEMCVSPAAESYHSSTEEGVGNAIDVEPLEITKMSLTEQTTLQEKSVEGMDTLDTVQIEEVSAQVKESTHCSISEHTTTNFTEDQHSINQSHFTEMSDEDANLSEVTEHQHAEGDVNAEHEDVVKPAQMQEMHQIDFSSTLEDEFTLQTLQPETNAPLDSQLLDNSLRPEEEIHSGLGNRRKLGSSRRNKGRQQVKRTADEYHEHIEQAVESTMDNETLDTIKMSLEKETTSQEELKNSGPTQKIIKSESAVNDEEDTGKMLVEDMFMSQNGVNKSTNVTSNITSSSGKRESFKSIKDVDDAEKKELTNLGYDTVKIDDDSGIKNVSHHDDNPTTGPIRLTFSEKEGTHHTQKKEVLSFDKDLRGQEINTPQTSSATDTVGDVTIKDSNTEAEHLVDGQVLGQDEVGEQSGDSSVKEHEDQEINASQEITHTERFFTAHNEASFGLEQNLRAVSPPAMDMPEESVNSAAAGAYNTQQSMQGKTYLGGRENSQEMSKQKRRKMGSTRRTRLNRNPEEGMDDMDETKESDLRNLDKNEVVEELPKILSVEVAQHKNANPSVTHDQSASPSKEAVKFVQVADVRDSETSADVTVESPQQDDFIDTDLFMTSVLTGGNICSRSSQLFTETEDATSGITGRMITCNTTQEGEERPESVTQEQALKAAEAPVLAVTDLEMVKSVVGGGAAGEHENDQTDVQEPNNVNEGIHNKNPQMKSPNLNSPNRRRKMGSTRKNFGSRNKGGDLHQKQEVDNEATETATSTDVKTESVPDIKEKELQLHMDKDSDSEQRKEKALETMECSHAGESHLNPPTNQTHEEDPVSHVHVVETQHRPSPNYLAMMPATSQTHEVMSESASGGRRRKLGSHRKSRVHQNNENETEREDRLTQNVRDVGSVADEKANKTNEGEALVLDKISEDDESDKKPLSNISTSKAGQDSRPVGEKPVEQVTPVQHRYTEIRLGQESPKPFSLGGSSGDIPGSKRYNVVLLGDSCVGKTSFMKRAHSGKFSLDLPASVGLDTCMWNVVVDGKPVLLQLWDTAGQERYHSMTRQILHKAHAFLLMYDITSSQSFSAVSYWANCIQEGAPENVTILLLGNKSDHAERRIKSQDGEVLAKEYNFEFMECSAATGENIIQSLETVARMLSQNVDTRGETTVLQKEPKQNKKSGCC